MTSTVKPSEKARHLSSFNNFHQNLGASETNMRVTYLQSIHSMAAEFSEGVNRMWKNHGNCKM
jgi:hypothetical protein